MKYLLDTHALIWYLTGDKKLSTKSTLAIDNPSNKIQISIASIWEIAIKVSLGKLSLSIEIEEFVEVILKSQMSIINIETNHLIFLSTLEYKHKDPFDRIIISQSICNNLILITKDEEIMKYSVKTFW